MAIEHFWKLPTSESLFIQLHIFQDNPVSERIRANPALKAIIGAKTRGIPLEALSREEFVEQLSYKIVSVVSPIKSFVLSICEVRLLHDTIIIQSSSQH